MPDATKQVTQDELRSRIDALPRVSLAHLPTPLDKCDRAAALLGIRDLWIKREDCTGLGFGGNKVRQHEFVLGDAIESGFDTIIQGSASQSNHSRQLAAAGARLGLDVHLMPKQDRMSTQKQGNYLVSQLFGATIHPVGPDESTIQAKEKLASQLRAEGRAPYLVGMGADRSLALAAIAYVQTYLEIRDQFGGGEVPGTIFTASQGSTQIGLLIAARLLGESTEVVGINPLDERHEAFITPDEALGIATKACEILDLDCPIELGDIQNDTSFVGESYGVPSPASLEAMELLGTSEGILLDPIYSGKAFAGMMKHIANSPIRDAVFIHTGGLPAIFAYADEVLG